MQLTSKRVIRFLLEMLLVFLLFIALYAWQTRGLLPADQRTQAPDLELLDLHGEPWSTQTMLGKPAVLYFFAPWCKVCAASSSQLRWFQRWSGESVQSVLIGLDWRDSAELAEYARRNELNLPVLLGMPSTGADYRVRGYPTYYVIDSEGRVAARDFGFTTAIGLWLRTRRL